MVNFQRNPFPLMFFFLSYVVVTCLCSLSNQTLTRCLIRHGITNFTTFPSPDNESTSYFELLHFSIQNLRFTEPAIPKPSAIVLPESVEQLVKSVMCCREGSLGARVRCGGHSYEGTSYADSDGAPFVVIDMMNLNKVSVDMETETAWIEGGATLGETYSAIAEASTVHGFPAGSCPTVGVGGHISGGGFGLLSRKYGLAADNVVDALLIDASGRLLDREAMGEDVFWAIRGGGGGVWGIIYAWKIKLVKVPKTVTGFIVSRPGTKIHVAELVNKWQFLAPTLTDDFYMSCFVGAGLPETKSIGISATFKGFYLGPRSEVMSIVNQLFPELDLGEEDCIEMNWIESTLFFSGLAEGSSVSDLNNRYLKGKNYFKAKSDYVRTEIPNAGIMAALEILEKEPKGYVILDPYGGIMHKISSEAIAFPHRKGNLFAIQYLVEWKEKDNNKSDQYKHWIREFYNLMTPFVSTAPRAAYINYMDFDLGVMGLISSHNSRAPPPDAVDSARVWGEMYFLNNFDRLVRAKTLIDPNNVFSNQQSIPPMSSSEDIAAEI
ncbi:hypothetical protein K2173_009748 [Erythroxylum novogranatense]|uniref:FAD-binding PCMH-type domain-containing protein n=1 Tax=Erythroxylum novogranatense TaxID=1862640 RepID=A0AAV8T027_9ROSI|nr:hypothetical protein K2173_009748 [Erythroxylum novogranatense]